MKQSKSERAGLSYPVAKFLSRMKKQLPGVKIEVGAGISIAAVLEYFSAEILELGGNHCRMDKKSRITPFHIVSCIQEDEELKNTVSYVHSDLSNFQNLRKNEKKKLLMMISRI